MTTAFLAQETDGVECYLAQPPDTALCWLRSGIVCHQGAVRARGQSALDGGWSWWCQNPLGTIGAAALAQRYTDGVCFVSLTDTTNADETAVTVFRRLRRPLAGSADVPTSLFAPCARTSSCSCSATLNTWCMASHVGMPMHERPSS